MVLGFGVGATSQHRWILCVELRACFGGKNLLDVIVTADGQAGCRRPKRDATDDMILARAR
jgi:hypothetical protein